MRRPPVVLATLAMLIASTSPAGEEDPRAGLPSRSVAPLVVVGTVKSLRISEELPRGGPLFTLVRLTIDVKAVEKGGGPKPGETLLVHGSASPDDPNADSGIRRFPGPGSRARFFLTEGASLWHDGIEPLDGIPGVTIGEAATPAPAKAGWWSWWSFFIGVGLALMTRWNVRWNVTTRVRSGEIVSRDGGSSTR